MLAGLVLVSGVAPNTLVATVTVPGGSATMTVSSQQSLNAYGWSATPVGGNCTDPKGSSVQTCTFGAGTGVVTFGYENPPKSGTVTFAVTPGDVTCTWQPGSRPSCP